MTETPSPDELSKTQKKHQAEELQKLGLRLTTLSREQRLPFALPEELEQAISLYQKISSHGAKRRQSQLIGKLMRRCDHEHIAATLAKIEAEQQGQTAALHQAEQWRDQLIHEPESLTHFIASTEVEDIQQLRQLIKKAQNDLKNNKNSGASRALFRFIKGCLK